MKKIIVTGATLVMALLIAAPSFAIEHKVTGTLTFDGILNVVEDTDEETMTYREMQLRIFTESKVNEKITLHTRFDVLDRVLNNPQDNVGDGTWANEDDNIQMDRAWMDIITPVGLLTFGRVEYSKWGTDFYDDGSEGADRIKLVTPIAMGAGKLYIGLVAEKALEAGAQDNPIVSNRDNDKFYLSGTYATKDYRTGLLLGYYPYNSFLNPALDLDANFLYIAPYFSGKIGPINLNAEFGMITGEYEMRDSSPLYAFYNLAGLSTKGDFDTTCYWVEAGYPIGKANIELGYYFMSGDKTSVLNQAGSYGASGATATAFLTSYYTALAGGATPAAAQASAIADNAAGLAALQGYDDIESAGIMARGSDWEKVFILTSDDHGIGGNMLDTSSAMNASGLNLMYLAGSYEITDTFSINGLVAMATTDVTASGVDDNVGTEVDLGFSWKCMDNLVYNGRAGYLMGGDWWKESGQTTDDLTITALYHELILSF